MRTWARLEGPLEVLQPLPPVKASPVPRTKARRFTPQNMDMARNDRRLSFVARRRDESSRTTDHSTL